MDTSFAWAGRKDGDGPGHRRFFHTVTRPGRGDGRGPMRRDGRMWAADAALVGFASDEGVRRNGGRVGAAAGPGALRAALASLAVHEELTVIDHGDVVVTGGDLDGGQARLGEVIAQAQREAPLTVALGGGHETAYGSHLGLGPRGDLGIVNLDAHFDLREAPSATSGTPFLQIARDRQRAGVGVDYTVLGVGRASNTTALFETAGGLGARWLLDDDCQDPAAPVAVLRALLARVEQVYLSIDLDVLPAAVAPGVSAPAALGVPLAVVQRVCDVLVDSDRLVHLDVAELNPSLDVDGRTARAAARLVHRVITRSAARRRR